jgi:hypothetical protein
MAIHRTAMGKSVDMASLASKNEHTRAVGNMKVNARGDTIDSQGRVTQPVTTKVNDMYSKTVGNRSAQVRSKPSNSVPTQSQSSAPVAPTKAPTIDLSELTAIEVELESNLEEDMEVEAIKAEEAVKTEAAKTKSTKK